MARPVLLHSVEAGVEPRTACHRRGAGLGRADWTAGEGISTWQRDRQARRSQLVGQSPAPCSGWGLRVDLAWLLCMARGDSPRKPGLTADPSPRALVGRAGEATLFSFRCPRLEPLMDPAGGVWPCQLEQKNGPLLAFNPDSFRGPWGWDSRGQK